MAIAGLGNTMVLVCLGIFLAELGIHGTGGTEQVNRRGTFEAEHGTGRSGYGHDTDRNRMVLSGLSKLLVVWYVTGWTGYGTGWTGYVTCRTWYGTSRIEHGTGRTGYVTDRTEHGASRTGYGTGGTDGAGGRLSPRAAPPTFTLTEPRLAGWDCQPTIREVPSLKCFAPHPTPKQNIYIYLISSLSL